MGRAVFNFANGLPRSVTGNMREASRQSGRGSFKFMNYEVIRIKYPKNKKKREIYILWHGEIVLYSIGGVVVFKGAK